jgi:hypothetical protein
MRAIVALGMAVVCAAATTACGSAPRARAPGYAPGPQSASGTVAVAESRGDRDSDGIPDQADRFEADALDIGSHNELGAPAPKAPPPPPAQAQPAEAKPAPDKPKTELTTEAREASMLVYTARVTMAVYQVDQGLAAVERLAQESGGYLSLKKDREITIRVPRARFQAVLAQVDKIGDVLHRDIQAEDVTDEYVDVEIRIKNGRAMQARLKELLDRAPVKEALEIEKELHRVTEDLERLEGKLKLLKDKIAYSTITVTFQPRNVSLQASRVRMPFPWLSELGLPRLLSLSEVK